MATIVVNKYKDSYDVYIGRVRNSKFHYGNPFSFKKGTLATVLVKNREESVQAYQDWLDNVKWQEVEPERRDWILANVKKLKNKRIACCCKPLACHGDVLAEMADNP